MLSGKRPFSFFSQFYYPTQMRDKKFVAVILIIGLHLTSCVQYNYDTPNVQGTVVVQGSGGLFNSKLILLNLVGGSWSNIAYIGNGNLQDYAQTGSVYPGNLANSLTITGYDFSVLSG
jgi:hypothetical protein